MSASKITLILCLLAMEVGAQTNRYVVKLKDKNNNPYSIDQPGAFLSSRALNRRAKSGSTVTADDLPVTPSYVAQLSTAGAKPFYTSRWLNAVLVEATPAIISTVSGFEFVSGIELVAPGHKLLNGRVKNIRQKSNVSSDGVTQTQLQMIGLDKMHDDGFSGEGIWVSILDSGFPGVNAIGAFQPIFNEGRLKMTKDFITNSGNVYQFNEHGTLVFSVIAADIPGTFTGGANKANYLLFVTEDVSSEYRVEEYNWLFAAEKSDSAGADVIQSSLGYSTFDDPGMDYKISDLNGRTAVVTRAASFARDRGIIVVVSAGNEGTTSWHYITPPADTDGVLCIGAVNSAELKTSFSSFGPTADGRIKPDVVALGQNTSALNSHGAVGVASGTSLAAPLVTSLVTGLLQAYPQMKPADIVQTVKLSADQAYAPNNSLGFGLPHYVAFRNFINSSKLVEEVTLYPNPVSTTLTLAFHDLPTGTVTLTFFDAQGKVLSSPSAVFNWLENPLEISVSNLTAGLYFLRVQTTTTVKTFRFVKV